MAKGVYRLLAAGIAAAVAVHFSGAAAQQRGPQYGVLPIGDLAGSPGLALALRKLETTGTLMQATAQPGDENNAMIALYARHLGTRVALVTATRGDAGDNVIGPERSDALGILRTEELLAAHRYDGAEQYFTRAVDFGDSFSAEESLKKWDKQEVLGDFVRLIRTVRPDVITTPGAAEGGAGQQQAVAIVAGEAFRAAADPARFPEQLREGLRPWQAKKLYRAVSRDSPPAFEKFASLDYDRYEPLLGCTVREIGAAASGMHMCQGRGLRAAAADRTTARFRLEDTVMYGAKGRDEHSLFEGMDLSIPGLARLAGDNPPEPLTAALEAVAAHVRGAARALEQIGPAAAVPDLAGGLVAVRTLRTGLSDMGISDEARFEVDYRLKIKDEQFRQAILLAQGLRLEALASDGLVVPGQPVSVTITVVNRGDADVTVQRAGLEGFAGPAGCAGAVVTTAAPFACSARVTVPADARVTRPYWSRTDGGGRAAFEPDAPFGLPFRPTPFRAHVQMAIAGAIVAADVPVQFEYDGLGLSGRKRADLNVVPALAVAVSPGIAVVPLRMPGGSGRPATAARTRELRVTVTNGRPGPASAMVRLQPPPGWRVTPAYAAVRFTREDEAATVRFNVVAPLRASAGESSITAVAFDAGAAEEGGSEGEPASFETGYETIEYPHIQRRQLLVPAIARLRLLDVAVAPALTIGYVGDGDDSVPVALRQLGARVALLGDDDLAWGSLAKYNAIITRVRAYGSRQDLRSGSDRLLSYVRNGGTLIVTNETTATGDLAYAPFPARVTADRVTDEAAPVKILAPAHPAFNYPNRIDEGSWKNWVPARGRSVLGEGAPEYVDLLQTEDPFGSNKGAGTGALVEARYGKGRWIYVGLALWRQLPAGTPGAYALLANLASVGKAPAPPSRAR
jgi:LmbE family N-acetylglucosaminyl deacetylase